MKKIMLVCSAGMSTSLLVTKMKTASDEMNLEVDVFAVAEADAKNHYERADIVLLGPQVRFLKDKIEKEVKDYAIPVAVIDSISYGMMDGKKVLESALDSLKLKN
ncbi:PTS sugar transporter subunit IIB [Peptostreptococcaceae bacterium AGR-M142]